MKRIFLLALAAMLMLGCLCGAAASAEEGIMPLDSDYFTYYGTTLSSPSRGQISITFSCGATCVASQLGVATYSVQHLTDNGWVDVTGLLTGSTGKSVSTYSFGKSHSGESGEKYRVTCAFICTKSDATTETKTYTSGTVTVK